MCLPPYATLDELIDVYTERLNRDAHNRERVKKLYHNEDTFDSLMERLIYKDYKRFQKHITSIIQGSDRFYPCPWRIFSVILDIVQNEGEDIPAFDTLTRSFPSKNITYYGWTFSWVHGDGTLISIFNRNNELVYRF